MGRKKTSAPAILTPSAPAQSNTLSTMFSAQGQAKKYTSKVYKYTSNTKDLSLSDLMCVPSYEPSPQVFQEHGFEEALGHIEKLKKELLKDYSALLLAAKEDLFNKTQRRWFEGWMCIQRTIQVTLKTAMRTKTHVNMDNWFVEGGDLDVRGEGLVFSDVRGNNIWSINEDNVVHWVKPAKDQAADASAASDEKRKRAKAHLPMEVKCMLCDCADYWATTSEFYRWGDGDPVHSRVAPKVAEVFPRYANDLGENGQNLRNWHKARVRLGDEGLKRLKGHDGTPSKLPAFKKWIEDMVRDSCEFGVPLSKALLYECLCGAIASAQPSDDLFSSIKSFLTDTEGLWTPSYSTFAKWLTQLNINMKSSKQTAKGSYPIDWELQRNDLILRLAFVLNKEHAGAVNWDLLVNTDETAAAYSALLERGLAVEKDRPTNMAHGDYRNSTLLSSLSHTGPRSLLHL